MISVAADLHMHSCVSPCGGEDMTPNNIVGMAHLKGLDMIAVADHNTARNLPAISAVCQAFGVVHLPAIEVQTTEDVHVLAYLPTLEAALELGESLYEKLLPIPNDEKIFGPQIIRNDLDEEVGRIDKLLLQSVAWDLDDLYTTVRDLEGICVPAHINRQANSILYLLGFMPDRPPYTTVEVGRMVPVPGHVALDGYHVLYNSDAHYLEDMFERDNFLQLEENSPQCLIQKLLQKKE